MKWSYLYDRISKQSIESNQNRDVFASIYNPKTHLYEKVYLTVQYTRDGKLYLAESERQ